MSDYLASTKSILEGIKKVEGTVQKGEIKPASAKRLSGLLQQLSKTEEGPLSYVDITTAEEIKGGLSIPGFASIVSFDKNAALPHHMPDSYTANGNSGTANTGGGGSSGGYSGASGGSGGSGIVIIAYNALGNGNP